MILLREPSTRRLLMSWNPDNREWVGTDDPIKAATFFPDDIEHMRKRLGVAWEAVPCNQAETAKT